MVVEGIRVDHLVGTLCEVGRVERLGDLGENGPLLASAGEDSLFHCLFGRDALRMAMDLLDDFPDVARATLVELARLQGVATDARSEEEPGRILHEFRAPDDPNATVLCQSGWAFPYYGTVDATPQWVNLLGAYCERYGSEILRSPVTNRAWEPITLRESLECALEWIAARLEAPDGGGFLWVRRANPNGLVNQVWEDSYDAYYHADGSLFDPNHAYAPVAVQGYAYDALLFGAQLLEDSRGEMRFSPGWLRDRARRLSEQVLAEFWQADLRTFALALTFDNGGPGRPARVVSSGPGHLLASRVLDGEHAAFQRATLIQRLFEPDLLGGAGIRTKSTTSPRFSPGSYHNGSIWPMDCGVIADGLRRHAAAAHADDLEQRILVACVATDGFPEFARGDVDGSISVNTRPLDTLADGQLRRLEQRPQHRQGWTATRVWHILRQRKLLALG
jgi:glycogen debranching enzyme